MRWSAAEGRTLSSAVQKEKNRKIRKNKKNKFNGTEHEKEFFFLQQSRNSCLTLLMIILVIYWKKIGKNYDIYSCK